MSLFQQSPAVKRIQRKRSTDSKCFVNEGDCFTYPSAPKKTRKSSSESQYFRELQMMDDEKYPICPPAPKKTRKTPYESQYFREQQTDDEYYPICPPAPKKTRKTPSESQYFREMYGNIDDNFVKSNYRIRSARRNIFKPQDDNVFYKRRAENIRMREQLVIIRDDIDNLISHMSINDDTNIKRENAFCRETYSE